MLLVILFMGIQCCESTIVENYLPEFKGTYDEGQDELLAADWSGEKDAEEMREYGTYRQVHNQ